MSRLGKPFLAASLAHWKQDWLTVRAVELSRAAELAASAEALGRAAELERLRNEIQAQAAAHEVELAEEKAARISQLTRSAARRMLFAQLARGWSAWVESWEEKLRQRRMIQHAASRLRSPLLAEGFLTWKDVVEAVRALQRDRESAAHESAAARASQELLSVRAEYERKLAAAHEAYEGVMQRLEQLDSRAAEGERQLRKDREAQAAEHSQRIQQLCDVVARRMLRRDAARAFQAWSEAWEARAHTMRLLHGAAGRLARPKLAQAVSHWRQDWWTAEVARRAAAQRQEAEKLTARTSDLERMVEALRSELAETARECEMLREQVRSLSGGLLSAEERVKAQAAKEKEERVELLRRQIGRRMLHHGLALGWQAWLMHWEARTRALHRLRVCTNRMRRPEVQRAFAWWLFLCEEASQQKVAAEAQAAWERRERGLLDDKSALAAELARVSAALADADEVKELALERQRVKLTGSADGRVAAQAAAEKEARVELFGRQILRRILHRDLSLGWQCWLELWQARSHAMSRLHEVCTRFRAPELSKAFVWWLSVVDEAHVAAAIAERDAEGARLEAALGNIRHEHGQLSMVNAANEDELNALRVKVAELSSEAKRTKEQMVQLLEEQEQHKLLKQQHNELVEAEATVRAKLAEEVGAGEKRAAESKLLIERLLAEQRGTMEAESKAREQRIEILTAELSRAQSEVERARSEKPKTPAPVPPPELPPEKKKYKGTSVLGNIDLDEGPDALPISQQIGNALKKNAVRVLDLFRSWDTDGDGEVTRKEFHKAMPELGLDVNKEEIDKLFSEWDADGGGSLTLRELQKILRGSGGVQQSLTTAATTAVAANALKRSVKK